MINIRFYLSFIDDYNFIFLLLIILTTFELSLKEIERIKLDKLDREECNKLLLKKGFYKKSSHEEEVPEEYEHGPYIEKDEL